MSTFDPWNYREESGYARGTDYDEQEYRDRLGNYYGDYYKRGMSPLRG